MKKLLSIVLAVAVLATMAFSMMAATASAEGTTYSLLPTSADKFSKAEGSSAGDGTITITAEGEGYKFVANQGWPAAYYFEKDAKDAPSSESWVLTKSGSGSTLNYDFEVVSGAAKVLVYFCGQNPNDMAGLGSFVSINALEMPDKADKLTGDTAEDLPVGKYQASVDIDKLGYSAELLGDNGEMLIGGVKIFAVGGEVVVNDISITDLSGTDNSHHKNVKGDAPTNPTKDPTTKVDSDATTTTAAKTTAKAGTDSAKTGDTSNAILFVTVAAVAAGVVTLSVMASKKQKAR